MRCELRPTLDTIGKHASFISNDESQIVTFYSYFGSHKLCLFRVWWGVLNMETQNLSGYWGEYRRVDTNCN